MKTAPIPIKGQRIAAPNVERNIMIAICVLIFFGIAFGIYRMQRWESNRARIQYQQEQKAIEEKHAVEVTPSPRIQKIPSWVFEVRKQQP